MFYIHQYQNGKCLYKLVKYLASKVTRKISGHTFCGQNGPEGNRIISDLLQGMRTATTITHEERIKEKRKTNQRD